MVQIQFFEKEWWKLSAFLFSIQKNVSRLLSHKNENSPFLLKE